MKVNPIVNCGYKPAFRGVVHNEITKPEEFFGSKEGTYNIVSDLKGLDVWVIPNPCPHAKESNSVIMKNKEDGSSLKTFKCGRGEEAKKESLKEINEYLLWYQAPLNVYVGQELSNASNKNDDFAKAFSALLFKVGTSSEVNIWNEKV